jgi:hypothetical protein
MSDRAAMPTAGPVPWGAFVPLICVVHCMAAPVLIVAAPAFAQNRLIEGGLITFASIVGLAAVVRGARIHGQWRLLAPVLAGIVLWVCALLGIVRVIPEAALSIPAGAFVAGAMLLDSRLRHGCNHP